MRLRRYQSSRKKIAQLKNHSTRRGTDRNPKIALLEIMRLRIETFEENHANFFTMVRNFQVFAG